MPQTDAELARMVAECKTGWLKPYYNINDVERWANRARRGLPAVVADLRELREAVGPLVAEAHEHGLDDDDLPDGAYVTVRVGDLRRLAACLPAEAGERSG